MSENQKTIEGWLRPLSMPSLGGFPFGADDQLIDPSELIKDLCKDRSQSFLENIRDRYRKLTTEQDILIVPAEKKILEKLVWPLKAAKHAFILGDYLGCISLCGMVCEMDTIFIFDLVKIMIGNKILNAKHQKFIKIIIRDKIVDAKYHRLFFDQKFEKLPQKQRIDFLFEYKLLSEDIAKDANLVKKIRNDYLHSLSKDYNKIDEDAEAAYKASCRFTKILTDLPIGKGGTVTIPGHLKVYLKK
mgnify:CR=1 FL=1